MAKGKVYHSEDACTVLVEGDKKARPEPSEHIIKFPGGTIGVTRTSDDTYWAHVTVNDRQVIDLIHEQSKPGRVVETRVDRIFPPGVCRVEVLDYPELVNHVAMRISTEGGE